MTTNALSGQLETVPWVTGDALALVQALDGMREGDEVLVDTDAWYRRHGWSQDELMTTGHHQPTAIGTLESRGGRPNWVVLMATRRADGSYSVTPWASAHPHIIAWRPGRRT